jgi:hypothetical protein
MAEDGAPEERLSLGPTLNFLNKWRMATAGIVASGINTRPAPA